MAVNVPEAPQRYRTSGECEHIIKSFKVDICERHSDNAGNCSAAQRLIFISMQPWKQHVSDSYRLVAMCCELH